MAPQTGIYKKIQQKYGFTDFEIKKMHYTISLLGYEGSKLIIMGIFFGLLGLFQDYMVVLATLLPIRVCSGGLHFNRYWTCFTFTFIFIACPIFLHDVTVPQAGQFVSLLACLIITFFIGPVTSKKRPPIQYKRFLLFRLFTCGLLLLHFIHFAIARTFPGENICFWVIVLQTIQLLCAKLVRKGEIYEKVQQRNSIQDV